MAVSGSGGRALHPTRRRSSDRGRILLGAIAGLAAWSLIGLPGCGGPGPYSGALYPVKGRVLLADGNPLTGGSVQFIPSSGGLPASSTIAADGTFSLKTKSREGAAPGEYKVRVEPSPELLARKGRTAPKLPFAAKYREYDGNTGLTATIEARETQLEPFRLDAK